MNVLIISYVFPILSMIRTTLSCSLVAALALGVKVLANTGAGVHLDRLSVNEAILEKLPDVQTRIGHGDLTHLKERKKGAHVGMPTARG